MQLASGSQQTSQRHPSNILGHKTCWVHKTRYIGANRYGHQALHGLIRTLWCIFSDCVRVDVTHDPVRIVALPFGSTHPHNLNFVKDCFGVNKWFTCEPELSGITCKACVCYGSMFVRENPGAGLACECFCIRCNVNYQTEKVLFDFQVKFLRSF